MRRLSDERGAVAVMVSVTLTALLGMGALVIDVGALYQERRELQNGADAAALAIAEDCARERDTCHDDLDDATAGTFLDGNATDAAAAVANIDLDLDDRTVAVSGSTRTEDGDTSLALGFARILGVDDKEVVATSTAAWGPPETLPAVPLAVEECEWHKYPVGTQAVLTFHQGTSSTTSTPACPVSSAGQDAPGSFGWLTPGGPCEAVVHADSTAQGDTGNDPECTASELAALLGTDIAIPIFSTTTGNGSSVTYDIVGFAAFRLQAYRLSGAPEFNRATSPYTTPPCTGSARCIAGHFTRLVLESGDIAAGAPSFGIAIVKLVD